MASIDHTNAHVDETGAPCARHPAAAIEPLLQLALVGSRAPVFHHDCASKLQGLMMALDELRELTANGDPQLTSAVEIALESMHGIHALLNANRALTKPPQRTEIALGDLVGRAAERAGVALRGTLPEAMVTVAVPATTHALALAIDVAGGARRGRTRRGGVAWHAARGDGHRRGACDDPRARARDRRRRWSQARPHARGRRRDRRARGRARPARHEPFARRRERGPGDRDLCRRAGRRQVVVCHGRRSAGRPAAVFLAYPRNSLGCGAREDRGHARWRRGSGSVARPLTTGSSMYGGAISTTGRRSIHPAVQSISQRDPARAAALRVAVLAGPDGQPVKFTAASY